MDGRTTETTMKSLAVFVALAAFAAVSNQDYRDAAIVHPPQALACIHCGER